jgi:hypothetical protein
MDRGESSMQKQRVTIHVDPGSELDQLLDRADSRTTLLLERAGVQYRVTRLFDVDSSAPQPDPTELFDSLRILDIIGAGASNEKSNIARFKDDYLADAADHREK